jgi:hypothetical protein
MRDFFYTEQVRTSGLRIRILLFSSLALKMLIKIKKIGSFLIYYLPSLHLHQSSSYEENKLEKSRVKLVVIYNFKSVQAPTCF